MSTKKKLIEATMFTRQGIYSDIDYTQDLVRLRWTLDMYMLKQKTPITKELLAKNGFEVLTPRVALPFQTWRIKENHNFWFDEYEEDRNYLDDVNFGKVDKGAFLIHLTSVRAELKTVADLEDALDLCGIDKDIEI